MTLSDKFPSQNNAKTVQLMMEGGGAWCSYELGVIEEIAPFLLERGCQIKIITAVSGASVPALLLSAAINSGKLDQLPHSIDGYNHDLGQIGDTSLGPFLEMHSLANTFNFFASADDKFPNIPSIFLHAASFAEKSSLPFDQMRKLLNKHISEQDWNSIRNGPTETFIGTLRVDGNIRHPELISGQDLATDSVLRAIALQQFAPYKYNGSVYEDYGYYKTGFYLPERPTDILFAIGVSPLRNGAAVESKYGIKTGQLHSDLAQFHMQPDRKTLIDAIFLEQPSHWNETSSMNNTSRNLEDLRDKGRKAGRQWIEEKGEGFGKQSSYTPHEQQLKSFLPALQAA